MTIKKNEIAPRSSAIYFMQPIFTEGFGEFHKTHLAPGHGEFLLWARHVLKHYARETQVQTQTKSPRQALASLYANPIDFLSGRKH